VAFPAASTPAGASAGKVRVLIVDDSAVIRGLVSRWLSEDAAIEVVGSVMNGQEGVRKATDLNPDVVILDIEMPVMDGITALPQILKAAPQARVIMASTLTQRGAEVTIKALSLGAADYLPKPEANRLSGAQSYRDELIAKVKALGARRARYGAALTGGVTTPAPAPVRMRPLSAMQPAEVLVIGSSTGGPQALREVVGGLVGKVHVPVLIAQHMPPTFTATLAAHLAKQTGARISEAKDGDPLRPGEFLIAPGDYHMTIVRSGPIPRVSLDQNPPENFCRPAVDPLFRSAAATYGPRVLAMVLTGMGADGKRGGQVIVDAGGALIAQDEATSVVWGMPGAVANAGLASQIKPLNELAPAALALLRGGRG
jgi:two-component system, chemotaxis family, protein-glutamate methylesterase/glutaminase